MRKILFAAFSAPALMLGGCGTLNRGVDTVYQPVVSRTDYTFDVQTTPGGLAPGEADRVAGWLATMRLHYGDHVSVDDPNRGGGAATGQVAAIAARYGILIDDRAPITPAPITAGMARVVVSRTAARVPGCPDFSRSGQDEFEASTTSNYGCATQANLAAMVADPLDLVRGQPGTDTFDARTSGRAIDTYRKATPTGAGGTVIKTESTGGK
ncbi:CpaD family pilus assembly protein [Sphingomonas bacterium]|uniref:CpaD family pilus assembly protein n=1 Tax=Sphingomonas bacterium TaxID=1895847 RepID=UPI002630CC9F|nr:CpaD family pilus assembly protein [Sphingomonas bacterium]MDB5677193.1 pilus assembly protein CpaD [Sphingomonas bacterium]